MRGARVPSLRRDPKPGIIPARAGSSNRARARRCRSRDHPRACGEQSASSLPSSVTQGSSPRMRGAARAHRLLFWPTGIIPAHAGSSTRGASTSTRSRDHPRACGEQFSLRMAQLVLSGSSPRMRGAAAAYCSRSLPFRIIPAHAGSSRSRRRHGACRRDHPRACGEQMLDEEA